MKTSLFKRKIIDYLLSWKDKPNRKPLVLRGARQVGKTSTIKFFAENHFEDLVYINLDKSDHYEAFKTVKSLKDFKQVVSIIFKKQLISGKTLLFIDEIQNLPNLIDLLRFFYEEQPKLHVMAAGSLLEAIIQKEGLSMPVGRVEYAYLYPLDFFEFLQTKQETKLLDYLNSVGLNTNIPKAIHEQANKLFLEYSLIGGMPELVKTYLESDDYNSLLPLYASLLTSYKEDVYKYQSQANSKYIQFVIENAPFFAGSIYTYENFGNSLYKSREMSQAFNLLEKIMILNEVTATQSKKLPLSLKPKRPKKLLYLDVGLVNFKNNLQSQYINLNDLQDVYRGQIAEQVVGQNLLAQYLHQPANLHYWAKEKSKGSAEVDFCFVHLGQIVGVEVKSGSTTQLKSLISFAKEVENPILVRVHKGHLETKKLKLNGKTHTFHSIPFYLVPRLTSLL